MHFMLFFDTVSDTLLAALHPPPEGAGELIFDDGGNNPLQPLHEGPSGKGVVTQL